MLGEDGPPSTRPAERVVVTLTIRRSQDLRAQLRAHPCHGCPDRRTMLAGPSGASGSTARPGMLRRRIEQRTNTIARQFDRVCQVLEAAGLPRRRHRDHRGRRPAARIYTELDLVAAECLRLGVFDGLRTD